MSTAAENSDDQSLYRLEGTTGTQKGGLVIMKKGPADELERHKFKRPAAKPSLLGLDKLAASKRQNVEQETTAGLLDSKEKAKRVYNERHYRDRTDETPSHTGGVSDAYLQKKKDKRDRDRGVCASSSKDKDHHRSSADDGSLQVDRKRHREEDREGIRSRSQRSARSYREWEETPRARNEPPTPLLGSKETPSRSAWDEDDGAPAKRSSWDLPTPSLGRESQSSDRSRRSSSKDTFRRPSSIRSRDSGISTSKSSRRTPSATPAYKYNDWMDNKKSIKYTPKLTSKGHDRDGKDGRYEFVSNEEWEEEQKRLDRQWYSLDEGYDESQNPFSGLSDEYTQRKEQELEQKRKKKMSARQRQIQKDNEMWMMDCMMCSGIVRTSKA